MTVLKKAVVKSYNAAEHKATVQIAGSLGVWLEGLRVATNIPPADVVAGRQCTVLFLDPSNQDDAVVVTVQGQLPSVGQILAARQTANLTLTTDWQSITGDGNNNKVRVLLPTPGDWLIEAACDLAQGGANSPGLLRVALFLNDSGSPQTGEALLLPTADLQRATVAQRWKVTTTSADTPVELKAKMSTAGGNGLLRMAHTALTATGVQRPTGGGGVTDHGDLTGLGDDDHPQYGALAHTETWQALQTFSAGIKVGTIEAIGTAVRIEDVYVDAAQLSTDIGNAVDIEAATGGMQAGVLLYGMGRTEIASGEASAILALANGYGTILFSQASAGVLGIDKGLEVAGHAAIGASASVPSSSILRLAETFTDLPYLLGLNLAPTLTLTTDKTGNPSALGGSFTVYPNGHTMSGAYALSFPVRMGAGQVTTMFGVRSWLQYLAEYDVCTGTDHGAFIADVPMTGEALLTIGTMSGFLAKNQGKSGVGAAYAFHGLAQSGATANWGLGIEGTQPSFIQGPTLIGAANVAPESGYALELRDDFLLGPYFQEIREMAAPDAPAANAVRLYAEDNGSGKTRLMARFASGAAQQVAIEP